MKVTDDRQYGNEVYPENNNSNGAISLLQRQEVFFSRILSRDSSNGFSSRIYYCGVGEVPFQWELYPGKPKVIQEPSMLPPLSPPPAILNSILAQERSTKTNSGLNWLGFRIWKRKGKRSRESNKSECPSETNSEADRIQLWSSEGSSPGSPCYSTSLSSSFSSGSPSPMASTLPEPVVQRRVVRPSKKPGTCFGVAIPGILLELWSVWLEIVERDEV